MPKKSTWQECTLGPWLSGDVISRRVAWCLPKITSPHYHLFENILKKTVLRTYLIITGRQVYIFQTQKNTGGDGHSLTLFYSSDGSHKLSNIEARGRRSPRKSNKVKKTLTKTTTPVKSQSSLHTRVWSGPTSKSGCIAILAMMPASR